MTDLVERLRWQIKLNSGSQADIMLAAVDEIERLRARVADLEEQILHALGEKRP